ncbi:hypothetical protein CryarDRAFT_0386 [Cryptosporangium arvum DSM 44712]|uniref:Uncharacterized protein n=1 Tax=Cryptosporangium arvum DSM 44712 TaxID=927661 RepID=A0A011ABG4_9ACTN|nr:hypothetical protein CryarDRAFT_0386 [Cryptosporangium arvum DSM 44712]
MVAWWKSIFGGRSFVDNTIVGVADAALKTDVEAGRNELLRVNSVLRADLERLRVHAGTGPMNTVLLRAAQNVEAFGSAGFAGGRHLFRATEAMAEAGRLIAPTGRPPCLFNPMHGPATAEVTWTPGESMPRRVPVCDEDSVRITTGQAPDVRLVPTDFGLKPYYSAGRLYADWILGWYSGSQANLTLELLAGTDLGAHLPERIQSR